MKVQYIDEIRDFRVVDGDTIECELDLGHHTYRKVTVRLAGLDCPEVNSKDKELRQKAKAAKDATRLWLGARRLGGLVLESKDLDKYGRSIGVIHYGDETLNAYLIESGHAEAKTY
jgi:micrococcal nuclease